MRHSRAFKPQNKVLCRLYTVFQRNGLANLTTALRAFYSRYEYALPPACNAYNRYRRNNDFSTILTYSASYIQIPPYKKIEKTLNLSVFSLPSGEFHIRHVNLFHIVLLVAGLEALSTFTNCVERSFPESLMCNTYRVHTKVYLLFFSHFLCNPFF